MIKVLKEKPTEAKERYYSLEDIKKEKFVCAESSIDKYLVAMESLSGSSELNNTFSSVPILSVKNVELKYEIGAQSEFRVFETRREMFLWLAED